MNIVSILEMMAVISGSGAGSKTPCVGVSRNTLHFEAVAA